MKIKEKFSEKLILMVDDAPENIEILNGLLQGVKKKVATSGERALELALMQPKPDLILLDIIMPDMDGYSVCKILREKEETAGIPVIFLTSKSSIDDVVKGFEVGGQDYVTKPFDANELIARINMQLELQWQQEELRMLNASKDKFFSIVAHDIKNPFTALQLSAGLVKRRYDTLPPEKLKNYIMEIANNIEKVVTISVNLLDWARAQSGKLEVTPESISISEIIEENFGFVKTQAENKKITLSRESIDDVSLYADRAQVNTVLRNLLTNALKFTHEGGSVKLEYKIENKHCVISVIDSGVGMTEEIRKSIFRIDAKHSTPGTSGEGGTGLGLLLCKEFVEKNKGKIGVSSTVDVGSTFWFTVPLAV